jgi:O-antigen/teichoic acid export membrane protein
MAFSNALLVPISVFAIVFCQPIVTILLGPKWNSAVVPMQVLFLSLPFRITTKVADVLMRAKNLVFKNANRKLQYIIVLCIGILLCSKWGLVGITSAVTAAAVFNYVFMLLTIKRHVFQKGWQKLILNPFKDGLFIAAIASPAVMGNLLVAEPVYKRRLVVILNSLLLAWNIFLICIF